MDQKKDKFFLEIYQIVDFLTLGIAFILAYYTKVALVPDIVRGLASGQNYVLVFLLVSISCQFNLRFADSPRGSRRAPPTRGCGAAATCSPSSTTGRSDCGSPWCPPPYGAPIRRRSCSRRRYRSLDSPWRRWAPGRSRPGRRSAVRGFPGPLPWPPAGPRSGSGRSIDRPGRPSGRRTDRPPFSSPLYLFFLPRQPKSKTNVPGGSIKRLTLI